MPCLRIDRATGGRSCMYVNHVTPSDINSCSKVHVRYLYLLDLLFFRSLEVSESTMSARRHSRLPEKDRCSPKYIL